MGRNGPGFPILISSRICRKPCSTLHLREVYNVCDERHDLATASLIEVWIDETERRMWFLFEAARTGR